MSPRIMSLSSDHNAAEGEWGKASGPDAASWSKASPSCLEASLGQVSMSRVAAVAAVLMTASVVSFGLGLVWNPTPAGRWSAETRPACPAGYFGGYYLPDGTAVPADDASCTAPPQISGVHAKEGALHWAVPQGRCDWYKVSKRRAPHVGYPGGVWQDGPEACEFSQATATPGSGPCNIVPGFGGAAQPVQRTWLGRVQTEHPVGGAYLEGTEVQVLWADGWTSALVEYKVPEAWKTKRGLEGCVDCYKVNFLDDDSFDFVSGTAMRLPHEIDRRSEAAGGPVDFGRGDEHESMEVRVSCGRAAPSAARRCSEQSASMKAGLKFCAEGWIEEAAWGPWSDALRFAAFDCGTPEGGESERYQPAFSPTDTWLGWSFKWDLGWGNCAVAWEGKTSYTFGLEVPSPIPQTPRRATTTKLDL